MNSLFIGKRTRLVAQDPEKHAALEAGFAKDTEFTRMLDMDPVMPPNVKDWRRRFEETKPRVYGFTVQTLADGKDIGFIVFNRVNYMNRNAYVGIGIGEPEYRGKGYGTEAMELLLQFGFQELNLHSVSLDALAMNVRAIRSYEKVGFVHEGAARGLLKRDGARLDAVAMSILRSEWEKLQGDSENQAQ